MSVPSIRIEPELEKERNERYLASFRSYLEGEQATRNRLDQLMIAGAGGSLALSVTFLDKIAPHATKVWSGALLGGWVLMLLSLGFALINLEFGAQGFARARDELDRSHKEREDFDASIVKAWNRRVVLLNRASLGLLFAGACSLVAFAFRNATM